MAEKWNFKSEEEKGEIPFNYVTSVEVASNFPAGNISGFVSQGE